MKLLVSRAAMASAPASAGRRQCRGDRHAGARDAAAGAGDPEFPPLNNAADFPIPQPMNTQGIGAAMEERLEAFGRSHRFWSETERTKE